MTDAAASDARTARRRPSQARSRERFDGVLLAASQLFAARGVQSVTMTDIANTAGMALPAVYRYFPNKAAIVRELAVTQRQESASLRLGAQSTELGVEERFREDVTAYSRHLSDPVRQQIRAASHADPELSRLDLDDNRHSAASMAASVDSDELGVGRLELERRALLVLELLDEVARLANRVEPDQAEIAIHTFAQSAAWTMLRPEPFSQAMELAPPSA